MANSSAADVEVEVAMTGFGGCFPQSANVEERKKKLLEQVDMVETARWDAGEVESMMTPNILGNTSLLMPGVTKETTAKQGAAESPNEYKVNIVWRNVFGMLFLHAGAIYAVFLVFALQLFVTFFWVLCFGFTIALGVTAGAHRLWAHRTYKATWQLRLILITMHTICFQNDIYTWARDHRLHHKYTDTNADPHNSHRGFFFSHMGWLLVRKHPDVKSKGKHVDFSDLRKDPLVMFQKKYYFILLPLLCYVIPVLIPWYFWNENFWNSFYINFLRHVLAWHFTWLVNSAAHMYGYRSYDKSISPRENKTVSYLVIGEGWHNYHHVFPWDYKAAELPTYGANWTLGFINQMAKIGWAYDLKSVPTNMVAQRALRTGDGSHGHVHEGQLWGWGDGDMLDEDTKYCQILCKKDA